MKRLIVEVDDAFHKELKLKALTDGKSMKDYVIELIKRDLQKEKEQTH